MARDGGAGRDRGRPKNTLNADTLSKEKRLQEVMDRALEILGDEIMSLTPKDVMILAMRVALQAKWVFRAAEIASDVAPYVHAKLSAVTTVDGNADEQRSEEELRRELDEIRAREAAAIRKGTLEKTVSPEPEGVGDSGNVPGGLSSGSAPRPALH